VLKLIALVIPLGLDTFAVAAALGMAGLPRERRLRVSLLLTCFEGGMPIVGLVVGAAVSSTVGGLADYGAAIVLVGLGLYMIFSNDEGDERKTQLLARTRGLAMLGLGLSISLDELAIGLTIGLVKAPIGLAVALIAAQAFVVAQIGLRLGSRVGESVREGTERLAGVALIVIGIVLGTTRALGISI
jgi:putative Mn2+ efflux pump MntP